MLEEKSTFFAEDLVPEVSVFGLVGRTSSRRPFRRDRGQVSLRDDGGHVCAAGRPPRLVESWLDVGRKTVLKLGGKMV